MGIHGLQQVNVKLICTNSPKTREAQSNLTVVTFTVEQYLPVVLHVALSL